MSKIIDITSKLNFEERPKIKIKDTLIEVNNDATAMLKITAIFEDAKEKTFEIAELLQVYELLFDEEARKNIEALHLSLEDFTTLIIETAENILGADEDTVGEAQTPAMI